MDALIDADIWLLEFTHVSFAHTSCLKFFNDSFTEQSDYMLKFL